MEYLAGFGNTFVTEAVPGTVPVGRNSPQTVAHGLYAEQLSGTAFTRYWSRSTVLSWPVFISGTRMCS